MRSARAAASVADDIPYLRHSSDTFAPASCSRSTPMICSSLNLLRFISSPFVRNRNPAERGGETREQVRLNRRLPRIALDSTGASELQSPSVPPLVSNQGGSSPIRRWVNSPVRPTLLDGGNGNSKP